MKYLTILSFMCCLLSCGYIEKRKTTTKELVEQELKTFNWNEVDVFPSFEICDSIALGKLRKQCFVNELTELVSKKISKENIIVSDNLNDTLQVTFIISENGAFQVKDVSYPEKITQLIPEIDKYVMTALDSLPAIIPAIKRGQYVKTQHSLPIIVKAY